MANIGPCEPWPLAAECCAVLDVSPAVTGMAARAATEVLWAATGRRFGECVAEGLLPCRDDCREFGWRYTLPEVGGSGWPWPSLVGGAWFNLGCGGGCNGFCSCNTRSQFTLPAPVTRVIEVVVDGSPVVTGAYRLENWRFVVRIDGGEWPLCNDGSWMVSVAYGHEVPQLGVMAATELFCEMVKACVPGEACGLPARVQTITRQGITQQFIDPQQFLTEGRVGLYLSDLFIESFNPSGLKSRPRVYSPDHRHRQIT